MSSKYVAHFSSTKGIGTYAAGQGICKYYSINTSVSVP